MRFFAIIFLILSSTVVMGQTQTATATTTTETVSPTVNAVATPSVIVPRAPTFWDHFESTRFYFSYDNFKDKNKILGVEKEYENYYGLSIGLEFKYKAEHLSNIHPRLSYSTKPYYARSYMNFKDPSLAVGYYKVIENTFGLAQALNYDFFWGGNRMTLYGQIGLGYVDVTETIPNQNLSNFVASDVAIGLQYNIADQFDPFIQIGRRSAPFDRQAKNPQGQSYNLNSQGVNYLSVGVGYSF